MTDREKLVEILKTSCAPDNCEKYGKKRCIECNVEHLLANGVRLETEQATSDENKRWIPVTERLPELGDRCLCLVKSFAFPGCKYHSILQYDKLGFIEGCIYTDDVTHWMPLPEPPKEDV